MFHPRLYLKIPYCDNTYKYYIPYCINHHAMIDSNTLKGLRQSFLYLSPFISKLSPYAPSYTRLIMVSVVSLDLTRDGMGRNS